MLNHLNFRNLLYIFLLLSVLSSRHIIIYNEELLVALSFFLFVIFVGRYFGDQIKGTLDENGRAIREICENLSNSKQQYLQQLTKQLQSKVKYKSSFAAVKDCIARNLREKSSRGDSLLKHFSQQMVLQCTTLVESKRLLQSPLAHLMAKNQLDRVLTKSHRDRGKNLDNKLLNSVLGAIQEK